MNHLQEIEFDLVCNHYGDPPVFHSEKHFLLNKKLGYNTYGCSRFHSLFSYYLIFSNEFSKWYLLEKNKTGYIEEFRFKLFYDKKYEILYNKKSRDLLNKAIKICNEKENYSASKDGVDLVITIKHELHKANK